MRNIKLKFDLEEQIEMLEKIGYTVEPSQLEPEVTVGEQAIEEEQRFDAVKGAKREPIDRAFNRELKKRIKALFK